MSDSPALVFAPEPAAWSAGTNWTLPVARRFRRELDLPLDRPIVMTGHQAEFWHAGILAKYLARDAFAARIDAAVANLVVDQDANEPHVIRYPARRAGALVRANWVLNALGGRAVHGAAASAASPNAAGWPAFSLPALEAPALPLPGATPDVQRGLEAIREALTRDRSAPNGARQIVRALDELLTGLVQPAPVVFASALHHTTLFHALVDAMGRDPAACISAYNRAAQSAPEAQVRALAPGELPLWRLAPGAPRRRVAADDLARIPAHELAPRGMLASGLMQLGACDLFIHGLGGGRYDQVVRRWCARWPDGPLPGIGALPPLAPTTVVTATLRLPLGSDPPAPRALERAVWLAHRALHDPELLGDAAAAARVSALRAEIRTSPRRSLARRSLFRELHEVLRTAREANAETLRAHADAAIRARGQLAQSLVAHERTWPFPLHPRESLDALRRDIHSAMNAAATSVDCAVGGVNRPAE